MYCKTTLLNELKQEIKTATKAPVIPECYTGMDFNGWMQELFNPQIEPPKELRRVSEQY